MKNKPYVCFNCGVPLLVPVEAPKPIYCDKCEAGLKPVEKKE
jgi:hypothetical protein